MSETNGVAKSDYRRRSGRRAVLVYLSPEVSELFEGLKRLTKGRTTAVVEDAIRHYHAHAKADAVEALRKRLRELEGE
jgi:hypothetical protein